MCVRHYTPKKEAKKVSEGLSMNGPGQSRSQAPGFQVIKSGFQNQTKKDSEIRDIKYHETVEIFQ